MGGLAIAAGGSVRGSARFPGVSSRLSTGCPAKVAA